MSTKSDAASGVPIPPEIDGIGTGKIFGTSQSGTYVTLTVKTPNGVACTYPPVAVTDSSWSVDLGAVQAAGTEFSATASYSADGQPSDPYVRQMGRAQNSFVTIIQVTSNSVRGIAPLPYQNILAWRTSDGEKIVDYQLDQVGEAHFVANYLPGFTLEEGDILNVVSAYQDGGNMTPYNSKPEGYQ